MRHTLYVLLLAMQVAACQAGPAGIVLYCEEDNKTKVLIADHAGGKRGWAAFGGGSDPGETHPQTAARETEEETRGAFSRQSLLAKIEGQQAAYSGPFAMYFAQVDCIPAKRIATNPIDPTNHAMRERIHYAWIPLKELAPVINAEVLTAETLQILPELLPEKSRSARYWELWIRNLQDAKYQGVLPWDI